MREVITSIEIRAKKEAVWSTLMDFPAYPEWNPFIKQIAGRVAVGHRLQVHMTLHKGHVSVFSPIIDLVVPFGELSWSGHLWVPGLFDGEHRFVLESAGDGVTRFVQSERFSGLLAALWGWTLRSQVCAGFESMNQALRERVEGR